MAKDPIGAPASRPLLRLWPGVVLVVLQWLGWLVLPRVSDVSEAAMVGILGGLLCGPLILLWWLFFSRAAWLERLGGALLAIVALAATPRFLHESVAQGNMGVQFFLWAIPVLSLAFVVWAVASRGLADMPRRVTMVATIVLACGSFTLLRSEGLKGDGMPEFAWRWSQTAEERLLARTGDDPLPSPPAPATTLAAAEAPQAEGADVSSQTEEEPEPPARDETGETEVADAAMEADPVDWPGLRGPGRDGVVRGLRVATDWTASPPVELWRRPIGPGVSSFAIDGERLYTHEQRGEDEVVSCYDLATGAPIWQHRNASRFWDSHVGAGPRATPALGGGLVFALGARGMLNALEADTGAVAWSRDVASDTQAELPTWGFVSSPLLIGDLVVIHAGALIAYDRVTGEQRWRGPTVGGYGSPQLLTLSDVPQVVLQTDAGVASVSPEDGTLLWQHAWPGIGTMQPALTGEGDILISGVADTAAAIGTRRLGIARGPEGWLVDERWTSERLKPSFSPVVVHEGHAYGFDGRFLACIDVAEGERQWKGGRYGSGQVLLLPDQDLLLVVSEKGDLALVSATADEFAELAHFPAIEGRTWNQPALVGDVLLVRNGQEMAAFRLPTGGA